MKKIKILLIVIAISLATNPRLLEYKKRLLNVETSLFKIDGSIEDC